MIEFFNQTVDIYRYSNILYKGEIAATDIEYDPDDTALVQVELDSAQSGTLYIHGSTAETITFSSSKYGETTNLFTSLAGATPSGLSGVMTIRAVTEDGDPVRALEFNAQTWGYLQPKDNKVKQMYAGLQDEFDAVLYTFADDISVDNNYISIRNGDEVKVDDSDTYVAVEVVTIHLPDGDSHKEILLKGVKYE